MSNMLRKIKRQRKQTSEPIKQEKKKLQTKQAMKYQCQTCGRSWKMWLQTGLEEHGENHKPVPFAIQCKYCGKPAYHVDWHEDIELDEPIDITEDMNYFANVPDCDCGKPIYRQKARERMTREEKFPWSMQETIENLKDLKVILQEQLKKKNYEGQGDRDVKEIALDFDRAIESLEKQIPKKPIVNDPIVNEIWVKEAILCPVCHSYVGRYSGCWCSRCGQALDWTEEGE